ncbi:16952_t:CDS:2, partial [Dentiscutata heterogama]
MASLSAPSSDLDIHEPTSEVETSTSASSNSINTRKKRKSKNNQSNRINKSHMTYFFSRDPNDNNIAYCMICKDLSNTNKKPYPYSRKGGTTSNMASHLREKHGITKQNYRTYLDANNEPKENQVFLPQCSKTRQE